MKHWWLLGLMFCGGVTVGAFGGWQVGKAQAVNQTSVDVHQEGLQQGQWPPRFSAEDVLGTRHSLEGYEGNILVLHFWASWCPFCRGEISKLTTLHEEWAWKGVAVLTVSVDRDLEQLDRFLAEANLPYPVIADAAGSSFIGERYNISGIPDTYILGRDGRIVLRLQGRSDILGAVQVALEDDTSPAS